MTALLKDRYKLGLILAGLFCAGILASLYSIYSLPHELMIGDGFQQSFVKIYLVLGFTFLAGGVSIWFAIQHKNEVIVFRDRQLDQVKAETEARESGQTTISLDSVRASLKQSRGAKEILQNSLQAICRQLDAGLGALYVTQSGEGARKITLETGYALNIGETSEISYEFGEGLVGQSAVSGKTVYVDDIPEGYIKILSGLGSASPRFLLIVPFRKDDQVAGIIELAAFTPLSEDQRKFVEESAQLISEAIKKN